MILSVSFGRFLGQVAEQRLSPRQANGVLQQAQQITVACKLIHR
nr:hypothetical protein [Pseudomonas fluorescens]